jgi:hypothetical protein
MTRLQILFAFLTTLLAATPALAVYSPELGRFRTRDPAGYIDGSNLQQYVASSPVRFVDPYGLKLSIPGNSMGERDRFKKALEQICPDAEIKIDPDGNVTLLNDLSCGSLTNPVGCECLNQAVNGPNDIQIYTKGSKEGRDAYTEFHKREGHPGEPSFDLLYRQFPGGFTTMDTKDPQRRIIFMPTFQSPDKTHPGSLPPPMIDTGRVPADDAAELAHELCGHAAGDYNPHDYNSPDYYRHPGDPAVRIENDVRREMDWHKYGTRDGNR